MIFFTVKLKRKFTKQNKTKQRSTGKVWRKLSLKTRVKNRSKIAMASCRLSSEIEAGAKNRLSPVQQKSKIPVRIVNRLNNNSAKSSSSKDEVNMKQRILKNRLEKSQNKPPSRIPIPIGRMNSKDVGRDKIPKTVITAAGKRPLGTNSGIVDIFIVIETFCLSFLKRQKFYPN